MKLTHTKSLRLLAAIAVSATLMTGFTSSVLANPDAPPFTEAQKQEWAKHRQEHIKARLAKMAQRLEIKTSQQNAWQAYVQTIETIGTTAWKKPGTGTPDAATIARHRADMASEHARKAAQIADATAKLQEVLSPEQRKTFDQIVMHAQHRGHHWRQDKHEGDPGHQREPGHGRQNRG
jgi:cell pole-organizing protein PopZ